MFFFFKWRWSSITLFNMPNVSLVICGSITFGTPKFSVFENIKFFSWLWSTFCGFFYNVLPAILATWIFLYILNCNKYIFSQSIFLFTNFWISRVLQSRKQQRSATAWNTLYKWSELILLYTCTYIYQRIIQKKSASASQMLPLVIFDKKVFFSKNSVILPYFQEKLSQKYPFLKILDAAHMYQFIPLLTWLPVRDFA